MTNVATCFPGKKTIEGLSAFISYSKLGNHFSAMAGIQLKIAHRD
jgi:hypothetical protein